MSTFRISAFPHFRISNSPSTFHNPALLVNNLPLLGNNPALLSDKGGLLRWKKRSGKQYENYAKKVAEIFGGIEYF
jgi:hypothetical protein